MIKCRRLFNRSCVNCGDSYEEMVSVGALCLCPRCYRINFDVEEIEPDSELGKKYYELLEHYKKQQIDHSLPPEVSYNKIATSIADTFIELYPQKGVEQCAGDVLRMPMIDTLIKAISKEFVRNK